MRKIISLFLGIALFIGFTVSANAAKTLKCQTVISAKADEVKMLKDWGNDITALTGGEIKFDILTDNNSKITKVESNVDVDEHKIGDLLILPYSSIAGVADNNLNYKHFINTTKISTTIKGNEPKLKDFFEEYCQKYHKEEIKNLD